MLQKLFSIITVLVLLSACATTPGASKKSNAIAQLDSKIDILADSLTATFNSVCAINLDQIEDELNSRLAKDLKEQLAKEKRLLASTKRNLAELDERCGEFSNDDKIIFGEVEDVTFIEEGLTLESRIDTGAETSSIGVYALTQFERDGKDWVRFKLVNLKKAPWLEYRILDDVKIKSRVEGFSDERFEIRMDIKVGKTVYRRQVFNLANRKRFEYQALLGRSFLRDVAVVDVGVKHQLKRNKNNKK